MSQKLVFQSLKGRCHGNQILLVLVHGCRWTHVATGYSSAAGRANVWLCPASRVDINRDFLNKNKKIDFFI